VYVAQLDSSIAPAMAAAMPEVASLLMWISLALGWKPPKQPEYADQGSSEDVGKR
jgi:hypothetical protein